MKSICFIGSWVALLALHGCSATPSPPQPVTKVVLAVPGASAQTIDAMVFPLLLKNVAAIPHVQSFTSVSRAGVLEAYVQTDGAADMVELQKRIRAALPTEELPVDAGKPAVTLVTGPVPQVTPRDKPQLEVDLDREKLSALGIRADGVSAIVAKAVTGPVTDAKTIEAAENTVIANRDNAPVYLRDVAKLRIEIKPDCIVQTHPK